MFHDIGSRGIEAGIFVVSVSFSRAGTPPAGILGSGRVIDGET